ncbi:MAG: hypothetical protein LBF41_08135 [Deltaproteobacteria bacterium]|jgi:major membrane immunogen (membrane-anchored lipoprotein)|nr:hypothetical protein [Deltaproteobacteria bacterium]
MITIFDALPVFPEDRPAGLGDRANGTGLSGAGSSGAGSSGAGSAGKAARALCVFVFLLGAVLTSSCSGSKNELKDGYFTAEAMDYDAGGWKDYLTVYVNNGKITIVEFDAKNKSGFRRSWDMDYLLDWQSANGVNLANYVIAYQKSLVTLQNPKSVNPVPGSGELHRVFTALAEKAIARAREGKSDVGYVKLPQNDFAPAASDRSGEKPKV